MSALDDHPHFAPIATAPRDGTVILVADMEMGSFPMYWDPTGNNPIFAPDDVGIWRATDGSMTWKDTDGCGPTHWSPLDGRSVN